MNKENTTEINNKLNDIVVKGARTHNLKNIEVVFPRNKFIVVTGVSGSGKSSLTFDTLFAEGQRRYAESLSAYARQFMSRMQKPDVDFIHGLCPAIAIEQKVTTRTPRSTVGSMTEIYDYLRILYSRIGTTCSPVSGEVVSKDDVSSVLKFIATVETNKRLYVLAPFKQQKNREFKEELSILKAKGFSRMAAIDANTSISLSQIEDLMQADDPSAGSFNAGSANTYYTLIDRVVTKAFNEADVHRLSDSIGTAFYEGEGIVHVFVEGNGMRSFNDRFERDGMKFEEPVPNLFSFSNPFGACQVCEGFGMVIGIDEDLVLPDKTLSVFEGAVAPWRGERLKIYNQSFMNQAAKNGFPIHRPVMDLSKEQYAFLWNGNAKIDGINAFFHEVEQNLYKIQYRVLLSRYRGKAVCPECKGGRLRKEATYVKIDRCSIVELSAMQVKDLAKWFDQLMLRDHEKEIAKRLLLEINQRLRTLLDVGLGYLTLDRLANSLSGGESQRIQLTRSLGSNLTDSLYILDEPSIGLHSRDTERLIGVLKALKKLGNTVVVVEHDEAMMMNADHIIDMGPLASHLGGEVVAVGNARQLMADPKSLTGKYLSGATQVTEPREIRKWTRSLHLTGVRQNNLKDVSVEIPLGVLCTVTGVSGSGKTTLVKQVLCPALKRLKGEPSDKVGLHKSLSGDVDWLTGLEMIDQNPIGKSSRSNPVTFVGAYDGIRDLFAKQVLSKARGFLPKHFSFNVDGGRCDTCKGEGEQIVEMQFLADVHLVCETCGGKRFKEEVLDIAYVGKNINDILQMSVDEALLLFQKETQIHKNIKPLQDVGLGYIKLGQSSSTLSGGEAQRVKLASFLGKGKSAGSLLFVFDEPTTGLHFHDIGKLLASFEQLLEQGHSLLVIEHNLDVIRASDWVIDIGPEAGDAGGNILYAGTPEGLKKVKESHTGKYL